jgi:hypothetical protein
MIDQTSYMSSSITSTTTPLLQRFSDEFIFMLPNCVSAHRTRVVGHARQFGVDSSVLLFLFQHTIYRNMANIEMLLMFSSGVLESVREHMDVAKHRATSSLKDQVTWQ